MGNYLVGIQLSSTELRRRSLRGDKCGEQRAGRDEGATSIRRGLDEGTNRAARACLPPRAAFHSSVAGAALPLASPLAAPSLVAWLPVDRATFNGPVTSAAAIGWCVDATAGWEGEAEASEATRLTSLPLVRTSAVVGNTSAKLSST